MSIIERIAGYVLSSERVTTATTDCCWHWMHSVVIASIWDTSQDYLT